MPVGSILGQVSKKPAPLTTAELEQMARTCNHERERRLLWEVSRIRAILRRADELEILVRDERKTLLLDRNLERVANALRADLEKEPFVREGWERKANGNPFKGGRRHAWWLDPSPNETTVAPVGDDE